MINLAELEAELERWEDNEMKETKVSDFRTLIQELRNCAEALEEAGVEENFRKIQPWQALANLKKRVQL